MVATAKSLQDSEAKVTALEAALGAVAAEAQEKRARLAASRTELATTLTMLTRLARHPPEALVALPGSPADVARSVILLKAVVPPLHRNAKTLRDDLQTLAALQNDIESRRAAVAEATRTLDAKRLQLAKLVEKKSALDRELRSDQEKLRERIRELAAKAKDLKDLMAKLEAERAKRAREVPRTREGEAFTAARGNLLMPAKGNIVRLFGDRTEFGSTSRGITIRTRTGAQVVAPYAGEVVFARPFRGYGLTLIIAHGDGYHTLLVGLFRIDAAEGQHVVAGEPVGVMDPGSKDDPELYVEVRRNGDPINPLPWLAHRSNKVRG
jgi:septal ring factor EnvC (AmiA/AmiB activator)